MNAKKFDVLVSLVENKLKELESNDLMQEPMATIDVNAPVALMQNSLESQIQALNWVLREAERMS